MKKLIIQGGNRIAGEVTIGGAKNSTVALIPAAILADTPVQFDTVPDILDVHNLMIILESMNVKSSFTHGVLDIDPTQIVEAELPSKAIKSLRASYYFMGALLGRFHRATLTFPGGDNIGPRPIDQHLKAFEALGANVLYIHATLIPYLRAAGEMKTKPTQHSVRELRGLGIQPNILVVRTEQPITEEMRKKIALF